MNIKHINQVLANLSAQYLQLFLIYLTAHQIKLPQGYWVFIKLPQLASTTEPRLQAMVAYYEIFNTLMDEALEEAQTCGVPWVVAEYDGLGWKLTWDKN